MSKKLAYPKWHVNGQCERRNSLETVLFSVSYLIDVEEDDLRSEAFDNDVFEILSNDREVVIDAKHKAKWSGSTLTLLDPKRMNCGRCCRCGAWTTDCEKHDSISGLSNGATVNGALLCDECLPKGHRWAF